MENVLLRLHSLFFTKQKSFYHPNKITLQKLLNLKKNIKHSDEKTNRLFQNINLAFFFYHLCFHFYFHIFTLIFLKYRFSKNILYTISNRAQSCTIPNLNSAEQKYLKPNHMKSYENVKRTHTIIPIIYFVSISPQSHVNFSSFIHPREDIRKIHLNLVLPF